MHTPVAPLERHQRFCFTCSPQVACFNACCRDLHQVLTPYDVLCLKQFLEMSSTDFLSRYTEASTGPGTGLPVVSLRFGDTDDLACPFVSETGCRVYPARPASCRTYPLARGVSRDRKTGTLTEHWVLIREPHCLGFANGTPRTVDTWVDDQQIAVHNCMNDMMLALISLKNRLRPGPLTPSESKQVYTALYDLDVFREILFSTNGPLVTAGNTQLLEQARTNDPDLLRVALEWVGHNVFNVPQKRV